MGTHLTKDDVEEVVSVLDSWPAGTTLTWDAVLRRCEAQHGIYSTRRTFWRNPKIRLAFKTRKATLRAERPSRSSASFLESQIRTLRAENARLSKENQRLSELFAQWQYNAYKRGITEHDLNGPMPRADRRRSVSSV